MLPKTAHLDPGWVQMCRFWQHIKKPTTKSTYQAAKSTYQTNISTYQTNKSIYQTNISTYQTNISTYQTTLLPAANFLKTSSVGRRVARPSLSALVRCLQTFNSKDQPLKKSALKPSTNQTLQPKTQPPTIQTFNNSNCTRLTFQQYKPSKFKRSFKPY